MQVNCTIYPYSFAHNICTSLEKQIEGGKEFVAAIEGLVALFERAEKESDSKVGLWHADGKISLADVLAGPCKCFSRTTLVSETEYHVQGSSVPQMF